MVFCLFTCVPFFFISLSFSIVWCGSFFHWCCCYCYRIPLANVCIVHSLRSRFSDEIAFIYDLLFHSKLQQRDWTVAFFFFSSSSSSSTFSFLNMRRRVHDLKIANVRHLRKKTHTIEKNNADKRHHHCFRPFDLNAFEKFPLRNAVCVFVCAVHKSACFFLKSFIWLWQTVQNVSNFSVNSHFALSFFSCATHRCQSTQLNHTHTYMQRRSGGQLAIVDKKCIALQVKLYIHSIDWARWEKPASERTRDRIFYGNEESQNPAVVSLISRIDDDSFRLKGFQRNG